MTKFELVIRELDAEELRAALLLAWGILDDDGRNALMLSAQYYTLDDEGRARALDKVRELYRAENAQ